VGRLVEKKGFPDLLRACALLRGRGVEFGCDIVGGGLLDATLRGMIEELGLGDCVVMHGPQQQSYVRALLAKARVFALAAQREGDGGSDNLPTVIMEAMVASLPVVSTKVAGIPEMVDDGETGSLVAEHDPASLADALASYLANAALAMQFGAKGLERAKEKFSITNSAITLARLLTSRAGVRAPDAAFTRVPALHIPFWRRCLGR
jgi:glycosyltransferase involved in cell wall biosynthesis